MLRYGADPDFRVTICIKPRSRRKDNTAVIRTLTSHGALVNTTNYELKTPLLVAVAEGAVKQTQTLLDSGANVMARDAEGNTVHHLAASSPSCSPDMLTWLVGKWLEGRRLAGRSRVRPDRLFYRWV